MKNNEIAPVRKTSLWRTLRPWVILVLILAGGYALLHLVVLAPKPVPVEWEPVGKGIVERMITNTKAGSVRSRQMANLSCDVPGRVTEIVRREGQKVEKGQPILKLDDRSALAAVEAAKKGLDSAGALRKQAVASVEDAKREHARLKKLRDEKAISQSDLDKAATRMDVAQATLQSMEAEEERLKAMLQETEIAVGKLTLIAPFQGTIADVTCEVGEWAIPGQCVATLIDLDNLYVRAELDEVDIGDL
ncbi:MAG: efflux RND transporter periplasmic adaptor subunit, partial [Planctomycetota bacterium]